MTAEEYDELIQLLGAIGLFNDKGVHWSEATEARIAEVRENFRQCLDAFIARVGAEQLPAWLLAYLQAPECVSDDSGEVYARLLQERPGP